VNSPSINGKDGVAGIDPAGPSAKRKTKQRLVASGSVVRVLGRRCTALGSCLGDNCQSSGLYGPVGSGQVRLGSDCGQCGLVRFSCGLWNDCQNDQRSKQRFGAAGPMPRRSAGLVVEFPRAPHSRLRNCSVRSAGRPGSLWRPGYRARWSRSRWMPRVGSGAGSSSSSSSAPGSAAAASSTVSSASGSASRRSSGIGWPLRTDRP